VFHHGLGHDPVGTPAIVPESSDLYSYLTRQEERTGVDQVHSVVCLPLSKRLTIVIAQIVATFVTYLAEGVTPVELVGPYQVHAGLNVVLVQPVVMVDVAHIVGVHQVRESSVNPMAIEAIPTHVEREEANFDFSVSFEGLQDLGGLVHVFPTIYHNVAGSLI
jgi:hypothetical protein